MIRTSVLPPSPGCLIGCLSTRNGEMRINTLYHHIPTISQRSKAEKEGEKEGGKEKEKKEGEDRPGRD